MPPGRQGWTESNQEGKRENPHCSASWRLTRCPEPQSQPAVHLLHHDHSQQEANCGAQIPRRFAEAAGPGPGAALSPCKDPAGRCHQPPFYASTDRPGEGGSFAEGPRAVGSRAGFTPICSLSSGLLSTCCVSGTVLGTEHPAVSCGGEGPNLLEAVASFSTFFLPGPPPKISRHVAQSA